MLSHPLAVLGGSDAGAFGIDSGSPTINLQNNLVLLSKSEHYFSTASQPARVNGNTDLWFGAGSLPSAFAERMNRIATVPQHERGHLERASFAAMRGDAPEEEALQQRAAGARILAQEIQHHVSVVR